MRTFMLLMFSAALSARAGLNYTLTPAALSGNGGSEIFFTGTLANTSLASNLYLNDIQINLTGAATNYLAPGTNAFFANVPGILLPGETYGDRIFSIILSPTTPLGTYYGSATIRGGSTIFDTSLQTNLPFQINLTPATLGMKVSGTNLSITWPVPPAGSILQQNTNLATATSNNWQTVTNLPSTANGTSQIVIPLSTGNRFYRLVYP